MPDPAPATEYAQCPTCGQYSPSIGGDQVAEAYMHFHTLVCENPLKPYPTGHMFLPETRDAANVLLARIEAAEARADAAEARVKVLEETLEFYADCARKALKEPEHGAS